MVLYDKFRSSHQAAIEINKIRIDLKLESSFEELHDLLRIKSDDFKKWNLLKMDAHINKVVDKLDRLNSEGKLKCLAAFANCLDLVCWLRENAPSLDQLKFLVDLASMSSTYNDSLSNLDRTVFAKTLKEAGTAYAALIYSLRPKTSFFDFMGLCETVCSHLDSDKNIAEKLEAVKSKIGLLKEIKDMRGNVELDSLKQAKQINEFGMYKVGAVVIEARKLKRSISMASKGEEKGGGDENEFDELYSEEVKVLELKVLDKDGVHEKRGYTLRQLDELQNILMLGMIAMLIGSFGRGFFLWCLMKSIHYDLSISIFKTV